MTIGEYTEEFYDYPIFDFVPGVPVDTAVKQAYRINCEYDSKDSATDLLTQLIEQIPANCIEALVIGAWQDSYEESPQNIIDTIIANASKLVNLKAIFVGDMTYEDCEISWIIQGSYKELLDAYPKLEALAIRGSSDLVIEPFDHKELKMLIIESGGLPLTIPKHLSASNMPALEHLELWLGDDNYGFDGDAQAYQEILESIVSRCPNLRYLGVKNSMIADELAVMLAKQSWVEQLEILDLSMGTLGDVGGKALLESPYIRQLKELDLEHHYLSEELMAELDQLPLEVNLDDKQEDEDDGDESYRYVSVSE